MQEGGLLLKFFFFIYSLSLIHAWDPQPDGYEVIDGPSPGENITLWRNSWQQWRRMELNSIRYDSNSSCNIYNIQDAKWTQNSFLQVFVMLHDRSIYDREQNRYHVYDFIQATKARVGKFDSVLLWAGYPNMGIDGRNQWDMMRDTPGGLNELRDVIKKFHEMGIKVFIPYNPWDTATVVEAGYEDIVRMYKADITILNKFLDKTGADAYNGDTMYGIPKTFFNCSKMRVGCPEGGVPSAYLGFNPMSWGYFFGYNNFPPVSRAKFLEPRHMVQICARWSLDRIAEIQTAFFNGIGYVLWENVWGIWNGMTKREDEAVKRAFKILRKFDYLLKSDQWEPYAFSNYEEQVFGTRFPDPAGTQNLLTLINVSGKRKLIQISIPSITRLKNIRCFDLYRGVELNSDDPIKISVEPRGIGAILVTDDLPEELDLAAFLIEMRELTDVPLDEFSNERNVLTQDMLTIMTPSSIISSSVVNRSMIYIQGNPQWWFNASGVQIEPIPEWTPYWHKLGTGVQFPWEDRPWNNHSAQLRIKDFYIDKYPVTNREYQSFLIASHYQPKDLTNFLLHWTNRFDATTGNYNTIELWRISHSQENQPVSYISWEDATAYAFFYGKRLPHDWEWQYVASNGDQYNHFPWGDIFNPELIHYPTYQGSPQTTDPVGSHPGSQSSRYRVEDLIGFIWQMTNKFCDKHTCGLLLRGGSHYRPVASSLGDPNWYFPQALSAAQHNRFLMLSESYDRSALIGFRCVVDINPPITST
jgi:iron(II)-dependent oxidoreductase